MGVGRDGDREKTTVSSDSWLVPPTAFLSIPHPSLGHMSKKLYYEPPGAPAILLHHSVNMAPDHQSLMP